MKIGNQTAMVAYLRPAQAVALDALAKTLRRKRAALVREGVDLVLKRHRAKGV